MEFTTFGNTGLTVSRLGIGLAEIGRGSLTPSEESTISRVLNSALDSGINFLDTAACYGISEELIGRTIPHRRHEFFLATKCGHVVGEHSGHPWSGKTIMDSIDRSLIRMRTDYLDLVQLHSCTLDVLETMEATQTLEAAQRQGKTRFIGYSGDNEEANWAVESDSFDTLQTSFSIADQHAFSNLFPNAREKNLGIIIKRPIANGVWGTTTSPSPYADEYFQRVSKMKELGPIENCPEDPIELAMGFIFAHPEVDTAIIGTANPDHLLSNIQTVERALKLPLSVVKELHARFRKLDSNWTQLE